MPSATQCAYLGRTIAVEEAIAVREELLNAGSPAPEFTCVECGNAVRPHREGRNNRAHFEHYQRNAACRCSNLAPGSGTSPPRPEYDLDDHSAVEGYSVDRRILGRGRNATLAKLCKERDQFTCVACGFSLRINDRYIIECHHKNPLGINEEQTVTLEDLVSLCPTCHRIAHTRSEPFTVEEIQLLRGAR